MCKEEGGLPQFKVQADVQQTMDQMMKALMARVPRGTGNGGVGGAGSGAGGSGGDGFSTAGNSVNVPLYGPDRLMFPQGGGLAGSHGMNSGGGRRPAPERAENNSVKPKVQEVGSSLKLAKDDVPHKYKQAVKRYFSDEE